jgi:hypothetical protein
MKAILGIALVAAQPLDPAGALDIRHHSLGNG